MKTLTLKILYVCVVVACIIVAGVCSAVSFSKYVGSTQNNYITTSNAFYFSCPTLEDNSTMYLFGGGEKQVNIDILNHIDALKISPTETTYSISATASNDFSNFSFTKNSSVFSNGTISGGSLATDEITLNILGGYEDGTTLTVTLAATQPYTKTITSNIILRTVSAPSYRIDDAVNQVYADLFVMTNTVIAADTLVIIWDNLELAIDSMSEYVVGASNSQSDSNGLYQITLDTLLAGSSLKIRFYKNNPSLNYSVSNTEIQSNTITFLNLV